MNILKLIGILFLMSLLTQTQAQKVGLVLSGGGSKGIAHIGVIRALEEKNIPIDYVAGTSIGAIVAGLYAIGYSPDEMEELLSSKDFMKWAYGKIDTKEEYYYKLKDDMPGWIDLPFERVDGSLKAKLPTNIIQPEQMDLRFMEFYEPASAAANYDFDSLMIPFFCIATDVYRNVPITLSSGSLSSALRASMTFPGYFKPISIDSVLLFDGGMENNFPTDVMLERFNPDVLIGVKVAKNPDKPDSEDLYKQLENVFMKNTNYDMPENGILIEPDVTEFGLLDFDAFDTLTVRGYRAAQLRIDTIELVIKRRVSVAELANKRKVFKQKYKVIAFENIYIEGVDSETVDYILRNIRRNRSYITFREFEEEYFKLLSDKLIKSIYPRAIYNDDTGFYDLYLDIKTKNAFSASIGGNISSNIRSMGYVGLDYIFQKRNIYNLQGNVTIGQFYNGFNGKFRMDFAPRPVSNNRIITPFYIDIMATTHKWNYFQSSNDWFVDNEALSKLTQQDTYFGSNIGRPIFNRGILSAGFAYGRTIDNYFFTNLVEKDDVAEETLFDYTTLHATYEYSTLNYKQYANKGRFVLLQMRYVTGSEHYTPGTTSLPYDPIDGFYGHSWLNFNLKYKRYFEPAEWFALGFATEFNYSNKSAFSNSISTQLGAPVYQPFPQSKVYYIEKFRAHTFVGAGLVPIFNVSDNISIRTEAYIFQPYQYILTSGFESEFSDPIPAPRIMSSVAFVWQTPLGPIAATASYFMKEEVEVYYQINFGFVIFNKRGLD